VNARIQYVAPAGKRGGREEGAGEAVVSVGLSISISMSAGGSLEEARWVPARPNRPSRPSKRSRPSSGPANYYTDSPNFVGVAGQPVRANRSGPN